MARRWPQRSLLHCCWQFCRRPLWSTMCWPSMWLMSNPNILCVSTICGISIDDYHEDSVLSGHHLRWRTNERSGDNLTCVMMMQTVLLDLLSQRWIYGAQTEIASIDKCFERCVRRWIRQMLVGVHARRQFGHQFVIEWLIWESHWADGMVNGMNRNISIWFCNILYVII